MNHPILQSATKLVFILMSLGLLFFTAIWIVDGKDFINLTLMVFSFYFGKNQPTAPNK